MTKSKAVKNQERPQKVAIIGAGVAGCAAAGALKDYGIDFVVYDKNARPGGLWANNYPGAKGMSLSMCCTCRATLNLITFDSP